MKDKILGNNINFRIATFNRFVISFKPKLIFLEFVCYLLFNFYIGIFFLLTGSLIKLLQPCTKKDFIQIKKRNL